MNPQQKKVPFAKAVKSILLLAVGAAILTLSVAPEMTKPLLVKYYRAIYKAEAVKTL